MLKQILTPEESRKARRLAGASQQTAARAAGISRTHLALWEVNKYILADATLKALRAYYLKTGFVFDDQENQKDAVSETIESNIAVNPQGHSTQPELHGSSLIDGFLVPDGLDLQVVEDALTELSENDAEINRLAGIPAEEELFGGYSQKVSDQITRLMARNYALIRHLHGHSPILPCSRADTKKIAKTNGDVLSRVFAKFFGYADDESKSRPIGMSGTRTSV